MTMEMTTEITALGAEEILALSEDELAAFCDEVEVPAYSETYVRTQNAGDREFNVRGRKAERIRQLIFADAELTRLELAALAGASVSRVGEVVWGLDHDGTEYPAIPKRRKAVVVADSEDEG
jgi:hypothetical protein